MMTLFGQDTPIGSIEVRLADDAAKLGDALAPDHWGRSLMTEAVQTITQMSLHALPVACVTAVCDVDNLGAARVLDRAGLLRERRLRSAVARPNVSKEQRDVYLYARTRPLGAARRAADVLDVLGALAMRRINLWLAGGWGVETLLGQHTRGHDDLDLACRAEDEAPTVEALRALGYRVVLDDRPARLAMPDDDGWQVDVHAVRFDERGFGVQAGIHGAHFDDPPDAFSTGMIDGSSVWCVSMAQQLRFDSGYPLRQRDRHDLATLRALVSRPEVNVDRPDG